MELAKVSEEHKKSTIDAVPKDLHYSIEPKNPEKVESKDETASTGEGTVVEGEPSKSQEIKKAESTTASPPTPALPPAPARVRHEWYQTDQFVFVDVFVKSIPKNQCTVEIEPRSLLVTFPLANGSDFTFTLDPLSNEVDPTKSSYETLSTKLSLKLAKSVRALKWSALEGAPSTTTPRETSCTSKGIAYPTSSRTGTKNWDKLEKEAIKDAEQWEKPDGDAAANALFRDIFKNASPEVRRAMEKSYVESNGTALSTNWEEVSKGKMETKPPDSMVAKKWEI